MKTSRIKNIIIVILALVNAFLLVLLLSRQNQQRSSYERSVEQLSLLLAKNGIAFDPSLLPGKASLPAAELTHDGAAEAAFARALLGGDAAVRSVSGGGSVYESEFGSLQFRANGTVDGKVSRPAEDLPELLRGTLSDFGYRLDAAASGDTGTVSAVREAEGVKIFNAPLTFTLESGVLTSVSGSFLSSVTLASSAIDADAVSALVRFLDYRNSNGLVCTEITSVECGYLLQSSAASAALVPAWHITTDVSEYYVNSATGEILRE